MMNRQIGALYVKSPLVSTEWLAQNIDDDKLRIVDIRGRVKPASEPPPHYFSHREGYEASHIPNSVFIDWTVDIVQPDSPSYDIALPQNFARLMGELGIDESTTVVAYDDYQGMFAARLWWALRYYGHTSVYVLDGGWQKWVAESHPISAELPDIASTQFVPESNTLIRATADEIASSLQNGNVQLIDVRSPSEFIGDSSRARRMGHIPGAVNLPRRTMVAEDGTMLPLSVLLDRFASAGVKLSAPETVIYCNSGVSASFAMIALAIAGYESLSVYDGSWKDWGNDDTRPLEK